jgi:hypothetical protein
LFWRLDENIVQSMRDWAACFGALGCNIYGLFLVLSAMLVTLPGFLFFVPIHRTFVSPIRRDGFGSWALLVLFNALALAMAFSPVWISSALVARGHAPIKDASGSAIVGVLVWASGLFLAWTLSQREIDKAAVLSLSSAFGIACGVWYFNQDSVAQLLTTR